MKHLKIRTIQIILLAVYGIFAYSNYSCAQVLSSCSMFDDDSRVWEYVYAAKDNSGWTCQLYRYHIDGSEVKYGKSYFRIVKEPGEKWHTSDINSPEGTLLLESDYSQEAPVPLLREEEDKVYLLAESFVADEFQNSYEPFGIMNQVAIQSSDTDDSENKVVITYVDGEKLNDSNYLYSTKTMLPSDEILLFDFSIKQGDYSDFLMRCSSTPFAKSWLNGIGFAPCFSVEEIEFDGLTRRRCSVVDVMSLYSLKQDFPDEYYPDSITSENIMTYGIISLEGVGNIGYGSFCYPGGQMGNINDEYIPDFERFNNLYDGNGNVIYPGMGLKAPSSNSINLINKEQSVDSHVFDIYGRIVKNFLPGSIYIQNGRKIRK